MNERTIQKLIMRELGVGDTRVFRNNNGVGWVGRVLSKSADHVTLADPRPLHAGLCEGSSDLIGWRTITITPDMLGARVAVFLGVEVKTERGRVTDEQRRFQAVVTRAGGIAVIARSDDEATELVRGWKPTSGN